MERPLIISLKKNNNPVSQKMELRRSLTEQSVEFCENKTKALLWQKIKLLLQTVVKKYVCG